MVNAETLRAENELNSKLREWEAKLETGQSIPEAEIKEISTSLRVNLFGIHKKNVERLEKKLANIQLKSEELKMIQMSSLMAESLPVSISSGLAKKDRDTDKTIDKEQLKKETEHSAQPTKRVTETSTNSLTIANEKNENFELNNFQQDVDALFENLNNCTVLIRCPLKAIRVSDCTDCCFIFPLVTTSLLIYRDRSSVFCCRSQQVRIHDCINSSFCVLATTAPIIEGCDQVRFARSFPFALDVPTSKIEALNLSEWETPIDFSEEDNYGDSPHFSMISSANILSAATERFPSIATVVTL